MILCRSDSVSLIKFFLLNSLFSISPNISNVILYLFLAISLKSSGLISIPSTALCKSSFIYIIFSPSTVAAIHKIDFDSKLTYLNFKSVIFLIYSCILSSSAPIFLSAETPLISPFFLRYGTICSCGTSFRIFPSRPTVYTVLDMFALYIFCGL